MTLKRDAQMPLYQQLANEIKAQIASGELHQNEQLMTEMEMSREYGVSRITVRKALELLVEEDILSKRQGVGAFVTGKKLVRSMNVMMGFTQTCEANGQKATSQLLFAGLNDARPADVELLGVKEGEAVLSLRPLLRWRAGDGGRGAPAALFRLSSGGGSHRLAAQASGGKRRQSGEGRKKYQHRLCHQRGKLAAGRGRGRGAAAAARCEL